LLAYRTILRKGIFTDSTDMDTKDSSTLDQLSEEELTIKLDL